MNNLKQHQALAVLPSGVVVPPGSMGVDDFKTLAVGDVVRCVSSPPTGPLTPGKNYVLREVGVNAIGGGYFRLEGDHSSHYAGYFALTTPRMGDHAGALLRLFGGG